jgi:hypothetical protein
MMMKAGKLGDITTGACEAFGEACGGSIITPGAPVSTSYVGGDSAIAAPPQTAPTMANSSSDTIWILAAILAGGLYYWYKLK